MLRSVLIYGSSHFSASSRRHMKTYKCSQWRCLQNEDVAALSIGTWNYPFSLFCMNNYFVSKDVAVVFANAPYFVFLWRKPRTGSCMFVLIWRWPFAFSYGALPASWVLCLSLRSLAHSNCVDFNQAALRAVLRPENISSSSQATQIYLYVSFVCTLQVRFLLSLFSTVSVAVWITVFARFDRFLALELNYFVFKTFYLLSFWHPRVALKGTLINFLSGIITG